MPRLFVYGTLRTGEYNNSILGQTARFIETCKTAEPYLLVTQSQRPSFPFMFPAAYWPQCYAEKTKQVIGDLFEIADSILEATDRLEGHPQWYVRTPINLVTSTGIQTIDAYLLSEKDAKDLYPELSALRFLDGDWKARK